MRSLKRSAALSLKALLALGALAPALRAETAPSFWMPAILGDHMVLQAGPAAAIWGEDAPGQTVTAAMAGRRAQAVAGPDGRWRLDLGPLSPGGPHALTVTGSVTRVIADVLVGEVWLGSGQSNMEFELRRSEGAEAALAGAERPQLRLFTVDRTAAFAPAKDLPGQWKPSTPETAAAFSAVAWHTGARIQDALQRPVGLVCAAWGGTPAEAWTPRSAMLGLTATAALLEQWDADPDRRELWAQGQAFDLQLRRLRLVDAGGKERALKHALQAPLWQRSEKPGSSGALSVEGDAVRYQGRLQGGAWGGASFPLSPDGGPLDLRPVKALRFQLRGQGSFVPAFSQASIQDYDYHAGAALQARGDWQDIEIPIDGLKQGGWGLPAPFDRDKVLRVQFSPQVPFWPDLAELAYNGMIAPLQPYTLKGVLWYQGESNAWRAREYPDLLRALVGAWRAGFGPGLYFAVVQLPEYKGEAAWAEMQAAQGEAAISLEKAFLVSAEGLGDPQDIHPRRKAELGQRLSAALLDGVYGLKAGKP